MDSELQREFHLALIDGVAEIIHEAWMKWTQEIAPFVNDQARGQRWAMYWIPYEQLNLSVKDQDRRWAKRMLNKLSDVERDFSMKIELEKRMSMVGSQNNGSDEKGITGQDSR